MSASKPPKADRTVSCLVCGKQFPRGQLDLNRHINAITLKHLYSKKPSPSYDFECLQCNTFFTKTDHLELHILNGLCHKSNNAQNILKDMEDVAPVLVSSEYLNDHLDDDKNRDGDSESRNPHKSSDKKTMECMICGKLFPRGPIDLHRHATAITLKHLISKKKSASYSYGCEKCCLYFTSEDHLKMHETLTTCNSQNVWPEHAGTMAGLRTVPRSQLEALKLEENLIATEDPLKDSEILEVVNPPPPPTQPSRKRESSTSENNSRNKKGKTLLPNERKAFYSIVSLLIPAGVLQSGGKITEDNFDNYIPPERKELVDSLKSHLLYST